MKEIYLKKNINLPRIEDYFTVEDSFRLYLYDNLMNPNKILNYDKSTRRLFFTNGEFPEGIKVIKIFRKKGYIEEE